MDTCALLATVAVTFFDDHSGMSALAIQHVRADSRIALVYHDAPGVAAARPLLAGVAETLMADLVAGQTLSLIETSMPEHEAEPFVYARVTLSFAAAAWPGRVSACSGRVIAVDEVARTCGIAIREVHRTEVLVLSIHRVRSCAFPGFRQLCLRPTVGRTVAATASRTVAATVSRTVARTVGPIPARTPGQAPGEDGRDVLEVA
ncbi:MAG TPA: hypothetical protein VIO13_01590 [Candidatus Dormibacteraeota bacterium]|jgi:hypothetical protein